MTTENLLITEDMKKEIMKMCYPSGDNRLLLDLGNCRLDFTQTYIFNGFTKKCVKLSWMNGREEIKVLAKVYCGNEVGSYKLVADNWSYIQKFNIKEERE